MMGIRAVDPGEAGRKTTLGESTRCWLMGIGDAALAVAMGEWLLSLTGDCPHCIAAGASVHCGGVCVGNI